MIHSAVMRSPAKTLPVATALVEALRATGMRRMFGLPGGGSSLDVIEAARRKRVPFVLARHETAAVMMAATTAELDGSVGAALVTKGPGTANAANGVAHAALDRAPVAVITDGFSPALQRYVTHQWFDQRAMLAPVTKGHSLLADDAAPADLALLLLAARTPRRGPVHFELTTPAAKREVTLPPVDAAVASPVAAHADVESARQRLARATRPVIVAGLEARDPAATKALRTLVRALGAPALVTYKAKGVIADDDPHYVGIFTGGAAEQAVVNAADLIVTVGLDPVELILQPWPYTLPVLELGYAAHPVRYVDAECAVHGDLADALVRVGAGASRKTWTKAEIARERDGMRARLAYRMARTGLTPQEVVAIAAEVAEGAAGRRDRLPRATVDAGAHMFSATGLWPCRRPNDLLISNGLATMGFALPAGIAAALHDPKRGAIAFTGDGGLMMCLGELATAVEAKAPLVVIVFNDASLSLIDIKQQGRKLAPAGVRWSRPDFAKAMEGAGGRGYRVDTVAAYRRALRAALGGKRPALIDVRVDPSGYPEQLMAMRGSKGD